MLSKKIILFLFLSLIFATTHYFAVLTSLYWYFWWFDSVMHFWGGGLIVLGVHVFAPFSFINLKPNFQLVLVALVAITITWEIFEWFAGLYEPGAYLRETVKDITVGLVGGLLAHKVISHYTMK